MAENALRNFTLNESPRYGVTAGGAAAVVPLSEQTGHAGMAGMTWMPSRPGEFHPEPLTDPDLTLSRHPARAIARRLPPSIEHRVPPGVGWTQHQLTRAKWRWPAPFAPRALPRFITTTKQSAPSRRISTFSLAVVAACAFSLGIVV